MQSTHRSRLLRRGLTTLAAAGALTLMAGCASAEQTRPDESAAFTPVEQDDSAPITVWADSTRLPSVEAYQAANPDVKMDVVTYDGGADGSTYLQTKVQLFDRTGEGWPDVVFGTPTDITWASKPTSPGKTAFAAPLNQDLVDQDLLDGFAAGSLAPCEVGGDTYCLRNDIAQVVLWYNQSLMDQFGYEVPTTWGEYQALGERVATEHPGYLVGSVGDTNSHESYFWSAQCPAQELGSGDELRVDLQDPKCTRMASLLDTLIDAGSVSTQGFFSQGFDGSRVLMANGPSWYGKYLFDSAFHVPAGQIGASGPLTWDGESEPATGNVGGGVWIVSAHSKNLKASTDLAEWLTTSDENLKDAPTYPAYAPGAKVWLENPANSDYFANDIADAFTAAADDVWTGWSNTRFNSATAWSSVVLPAITGGASLTDTLPAWQQAITDEAKTVGYTVVNE
ncbi:ABC transporter substrate-binding protein [Microbacterium sp. EST19A]|uniref:ABC transporter substrate-binding protein n=1 Tax=Microbacterium sp. EST19A TaxID=2862681 RepID=UPI001CBF5196|nr:ABC transporter substrate-binding protein [Microbacterium sp. EST19A]